VRAFFPANKDTHMAAPRTHRKPTYHWLRDGDVIEVPEK